eukprot:m.4749 g.4749  ORF g.4749 m.4749 type:complete len:339 (-) comp7171_c0_seq1:98-1114(-)
MTPFVATKIALAMVLMVVLKTSYAMEPLVLTEDDETFVRVHMQKVFKFNVTSGTFRVTVQPCLGKVNWTLEAPNGLIVDGLYWDSDHTHRPAPTHDSSVTAFNFDETVGVYTNEAAMNGQYTLTINNLYDGDSMDHQHHRRMIPTNIANVTLYLSQDLGSWPYPELPLNSQVRMVASGSSHNSILLEWDPSPSSGVSYCVHAHAMGGMKAHYVHATPCSMHIDGVPHDGELNICMSGSEQHVLLKNLNSSMGYMIDVVVYNEDKSAASAYLGGVFTTATTPTTASSESSSDDNVKVGQAVGYTILGCALLAAVVIVLAVVYNRRKSISPGSVTLENEA